MLIAHQDKYDLLAEVDIFLRDKNFESVRIQDKIKRKSSG